jgi:hypothetical protein
LPPEGEIQEILKLWILGVSADDLIYFKLELN